jgi:hypothetical protein
MTVQQAHLARQKSWNRLTKDLVYSSGGEPDHAWMSLTYFFDLEVIWQLGYLGSKTDFVLFRRPYNLLIQLCNDLTVG